MWRSAQYAFIVASHCFIPTGYRRKQRGRANKMLVGRSCKVRSIAHVAPQLPMLHSLLLFHSGTKGITNDLLRIKGYYWAGRLQVPGTFNCMQFLILLFCCLSCSFCVSLHYYITLLTWVSVFAGAARCQFCRHLQVSWFFLCGTYVVLQVTSPTGITATHWLCRLLCSIPFCFPLPCKDRLGSCLCRSKMTEGSPHFRPIQSLELNGMGVL